MRAAFGLAALLTALAAGYWIYSAQLGPAGDSGSPALMTQLDLAAIRSDLLSLAQSERLYLAANGAYATMEELRQAGATGDENGRRHYRYQVTADGARHFRIVAIPADPSNPNRPVLTIDETMQIR